MSRAFLQISDILTDSRSLIDKILKIPDKLFSRGFELLKNLGKRSGLKFPALLIHSFIFDKLEFFLDAVSMRKRRLFSLNEKPQFINRNGDMTPLFRADSI